MIESIKQYAEALSGLTEVPRKRARRIAVSLSKQGVIPTGQIRSVATGIIERSRENRRRVTDLVVTQVRKQAGALGLATAEEIERLRRRVVALEGGSAPKAPATKAPARKTRATAPRTTSKRTAPAPKAAKRAAAAAKPKASSGTKRRTVRPRKRASATRRR